MSVLLSAGMVAWSLLLSNALASDGGIPMPHVTGEGITSLGVVFFVVYWMTRHSDARDKAFSDLIAKSLDVIEKKDLRYETMARECQEASAKILDKLLQIELTREE